MFDRYLRKKFIKSLGEIKLGELRVQFPEGDVKVFTGDKGCDKADITIYDWRVIANLINKGNVGLASDYRDGYWTTTDLESLINFGIINEGVFNTYQHGKLGFRILARLLHFARRNTIKGSRKNIEAHYDLGNEFYSLWLDQSMSYSSAIFNHPNDDLSSAQNFKYKRLLNKVSKPNAEILEIGCGWGGFAEIAVKEGHYVKGITLSSEQANYAAQRLYESNALIALEDYRHQSGLYDYIVSIEMLEAVGRQYWSTYFKKLKSLLKPGGKILLQTITIADHLFKDYARMKNMDMIRTFIFPGGLLPSEEKLDYEFKKHGLICKDIYRFGHDYALTLRKWLDSFDKKYAQVKNLGFDDEFIRLWRFYLAACSAGFATGRINVVQLELESL